jgi:hypothetical protein
MKTHLHSEQFDGYIHALCGSERGIVLMEDAFDASPPENRCA